MKILQTFALVILLFAAQSYSQEEITAGIEIESITTKPSIETENPESLISSVFAGLENNEEDKTSPEIDSLTLPSEEAPIIELSISDGPKPDEEVSTTISAKQETDSSSSPSEEPTPINESSATESQTINEEVPITVPEIQESSSISAEIEPSSESPTASVVDAEQSPTSSSQGPDSESVPEQQPSETITCVCDCGVDSALPQKCEESSTETVVVENENIPSSDPSISEVEKDIEDVVSEAIDAVSDIVSDVVSDVASDVSETESPVADEETLATISLEPETTQAVVEETSSVDSANSSTNLPEEGTESSGTNLPNDKETITETDEALQPEVTTSPSDESTGSDSEPELNSETTSDTPNPPPESVTESNKISIEPEVTTESEVTTEPEVSSEPEVTVGPVEVSSTTINPCTEVGNFPISSNCRKYLSCSGNATDLVSEEIQCPERSAFSPVLKRCTRDLSSCVEEEPTCLLAGSLPNPNGENSSYFWCVPSLLGGFHKYHIQCSVNEIFTSLLGRCWIETPQLGLGFGLTNSVSSDRDVVKAEWKLLKKEIKLKAREEKIRKKLEEKAKARAEKLAAKELKKQKKVVDDDDDDDDDGEEEDD